MNKVNKLKEALDNKFIIFLCEGTNEESIINFFHNNNMMYLDSNKYRLDLLRKGRGKSIKNNIEPELELDYGYSVAIVYILDSIKEKIKLNKCINAEIYYLLTPPEFEILYIIKNNWLDEYNKNKIKPSLFCKKKNNKINFKNKDAFTCHLNDKKELKDVLYNYKIYQSKKSDVAANKNCFYLYDILK